MGDKKVISDAKKTEFDQFRRDLKAQFEPASPIECVAFDTIVSWVKVGTRLIRKNE